MPAGLQTWDENGNLLIDTSTFMGRLLGSIDASAMSGSATVAGLSEGEPFAIPVLNAGNGSFSYGSVTIPACTYSGNTVSWTRQALPSGAGSVPACTLIIGVR